MKWNRKIVALVAVVAVVLIVVLLVVFTPREMKIAEDITLEPITWSYQRPDNPAIDAIVNELLESPYSNDEISLAFYVAILRYITSPYDPYDELWIAFALNASVNKGGFIHSIQATIYKDNETTIDWLETSVYAENLSETDREDGGFESQQAFIKFEGKDNPQRVFVSTHANCDFFTPSSESHQLEIVIEVIYHNGTVYKRIVQPFQLNIMGSE